MLYFTWNQNNKPRTTKIDYKQPKIILEHIKHNQTHQTHQIQQMEKMYQENHMNHNKQGGKSWKRNLSCFRITNFKLFNWPLNAYNHKG